MESLVEVSVEDGRVTRCSGRPPLTPRVTGPGVVHLLGTGGGPLPGDRTRIVVTVGAGQVLTLASVAATVAQRGPDELAPTSVWHWDVTVGPGATLIVPGAPLVAAHGCRHRVSADVTLADDARLVWCDQLVAGRTAEAPGELTSELRVHRAGAPVLEQELSVALLAPERCVGSRLDVGPTAATAVGRLGPRAAVMPLAARDASLLTALGNPVDVARILAA